MYASHNSLTFAKPRKVWQWLFNPFSKCQRVNLEKQIEEGARFFDIRTRLTDDGKFIACHGLVEYKISVLRQIRLLEQHKCYYRVILEDKVGGKHCTADDLNELESLFCSADYPHCVYVARKSDLNKIYNVHCDFKPTEHTRHHWTYGKPFIPRWHVGNYKAGKYAESLNLEMDNNKVFYYDFVDIK